MYEYRHDAGGFVWQRTIITQPSEQLMGPSVTPRITVAPTLPLEGSFEGSALPSSFVVLHTLLDKRLVEACNNINNNHAGGDDGVEEADAAAEALRLEAVVNGLSVPVTVVPKEEGDATTISGGGGSSAVALAAGEVEVSPAQLVPVTLQVDVSSASPGPMFVQAWRGAVLVSRRSVLLLPASFGGAAEDMGAALLAGTVGAEQVVDDVALLLAASAACTTGQHEGHRRAQLPADQLEGMQHHLACWAQSNGLASLEALLLSTEVGGGMPWGSFVVGGIAAGDGYIDT